MSITIKDIAKLAGVSTSTVSLVISGKGYISETTRKKVQKVIDEYNYRPLRSARQLSANRTGNVGFIISDVHLSRSEAFYSRILLGAELEARNHDEYILLSTSSLNIKIPDDLPRFMQGRDVDGVIVAGSVNSDLVKYLVQVKMPTVLIDYQVPGIKVDSVIMDNRSGVRQLVKHLYDQGCRKIGFLGGSNYHTSIQERFEGYRLEMNRLGLSDVAENKNYYYLVQEETTADIGAQGIQRILNNTEDLEAVICVNDTTAAGCLQHLAQLGHSVPNGVAVVGFDDINYAAVTHPPLTSVHVPKTEMGVEAMKLLMERIADMDRLHQTRLVPVELVVRESSQCNLRTSS